MSNIAHISSIKPAPRVAFHRTEMSKVLDIYGRLVMSGEARDYAIGMFKDQAVFSIFRRHAESPTWQVIKTPALSKAQGAFSVTGSQGQVLKRGHELVQVLKVFDTRRFAIVS